MTKITTLPSLKDVLQNEEEDDLDGNSSFNNSSFRKHDDAAKGNEKMFLQGKSKATRFRLKQVSFRNRSEIFHIETIDDLSEEEMQSIWYRSKDFRRFERDTKTIIKKITRGEHTDDICFRGLEDRHGKLGKKRRVRRHLAIQAVLKEQDIQAEKGVLLPSRLATVSVAYSNDAMIEAIDIGMSDEEDIQSYIACNSEKSKSLPKVPQRRSTMDQYKLQASIRDLSKLFLNGEECCSDDESGSTIGLQDSLELIDGDYSNTHNSTREKL